MIILILSLLSMVFLTFADLRLKPVVSKRGEKQSETFRVRRHLPLGRRGCR